ncbi:hypothetical protein [Rufibacter ruber]|uniref:hypothetical protein n=1 Tax=Rufibacter ruber TaxID=1783499 RepID=UPI0012905760|nr:hypothetical protein [Rufibacter ruber]
MRKIVLIFVGLVAALQAKTQQKAGQENTNAQVVVQTQKPLHPIHPDFWGTNFLYWVDDDAALADGKIVQRLKDVNMKVLRYPGGTVADNFHWQTATLDNTNMFPYESGPAETDFDEFMAQCKKVGATPSLVLNTESWAVKKDIPGGAHEAANWLRYCKKKGYQVKYWEIGNETYWHPVMSADEYAHLVNVYADSMRRVDPNVVLGVNGHWDVNFVGTKERIKESQLPRVLQMRENITSRESYNAYKKFHEENTIKPITTGEQKWWETVAGICGKNVNMIIVHWYFGANQLPMVTRKLLEVRELFAQKNPGKNYLLNLSEYNVLERNATSHLELTEMVGAMLEAKTDLAMLWPMRMAYKKPTLVDVKTAQPTMVYQIHRKLSQSLKGAVVPTEVKGDFAAFASTAANGKATVVLSGSKIDKVTPVTVLLAGAKSNATSCSVWRISGSEFDYQVKEEKVAVKNGKAIINLSPLEVVVAELK